MVVFRGSTIARAGDSRAAAASREESILID
jgi:hypothetical protein